MGGESTPRWASPWRKRRPRAVHHLRRALFIAGLAAIVAPTVTVSSASASEPAPALVHVGRAPAVPPGSVAVSALDPATLVRADVTLEPRDPSALATYADGVSTPGSSLYRHYLPRGAFVRLFGPTQGVIDAVEQALAAAGLHPGPISSNHLIIPVSAPAAELAKAFAIGFQQYRLPSGRLAFANMSPPSLPAAVAADVQGIVGLDDLYLANPHISPPTSRAATPLAPRPAIVTGGPQPCTDAIDTASYDSSYTSDEIAYAYSFSSLYTAGDLGGGQTVAVMEWESDLRSDIAAYQSCYGTTAPVTYVKTDGGPPSGAGAGEAALDIEDIAGLAPGVSIIDYEAPNSGPGWLDNWTAAISGDAAKVISDSWGLCEPENDSTDASAENTLFEQAAVQGQTIVAAAGDAGSQDCLDPWEPLGGHNDDDQLAVDDPAAQPFVTGAGGTTLESPTSSPTETVWNDGMGGGAGGGGISENWPMPQYQADAPASLGVVNTNSSGTPCGASSGAYCREVPDVSADADPETGYVMYWDGSWVGTGGTSAAAPTWAALFALTDASSSCAGGTIGFANPDLYQVAAADPSAFNDVTSGNNDITGRQHGLYPAQAGYDMASGLGTPDAALLSSALCGGATPDPVQVTNPGPQSAYVGQVATIQVVATDSNVDQTLSFSALGLPPGLSLGSSTGLISGQPTDPGVYSVIVTAEDGTGASASTTFSILVPSSISHLDPAHGPASGGTGVTIRGVGFSGTTAVMFGSSAAEFTVSRAGTSILAHSPGGTGWVTVEVVGLAGTSATSLGTLFDYGPTVSRLMPRRGGGGTKVTIVGTNFTGANAVSFGDVPATRFSVQSRTRIVAYAPGQAPGQVVVTVTTPGGTSPTTDTGAFTYR